ncbi:MAG: hypothetical protein PG981_000732 [Wolbachia endosymbiont of Ctenocephalides orientis wCori]|nr:MAG: hypothetical protein PG981_000732 [Wolbachia endosymbiont of Ctenocephalides orientis wCori]
MGKIVFNDLNKVKFSQGDLLINHNGNNQNEFQTKLSALAA